MTCVNMSMIKTYGKYKKYSLFSSSAENVVGLQENVPK